MDQTVFLYLFGGLSWSNKIGIISEIIFALFKKKYFLLHIKSIKLRLKKSFFPINFTNQKERHFDPQFPALAIV